MIQVTFDSSLTGNRDLVNTFKSIGVDISQVLTDGDLEARKAALAEKREDGSLLLMVVLVVLVVLVVGGGGVFLSLSLLCAVELRKYRNSFWLSMLFTVPIFFITMICPMIPYLHEYFNQSVFKVIP